MDYVISEASLQDVKDRAGDGNTPAQAAVKIKIIEVIAEMLQSTKLWELRKNLNQLCYEINEESEIIAEDRAGKDLWILAESMYDLADLCEEYTYTLGTHVETRADYINGEEKGD